MSLIVLLVVVYLGVYVVLSVPAVQNKLKEKVSTEVSKLVGGNIEIGTLAVAPFSEVMLKDVTLTSPTGGRCAGIDRVAAGIDLWRLVRDKRIILNYAEIIGLYVDVVQPEEKSPLNIQFLIDALSPKDKDKPSALFDLRIRNIVVRESKASLSRPWMTDESGSRKKFANIEVDRLRMDLSIPELRNDKFVFDVRNMQFDVTPDVSVRHLSARVEYLKNDGKVDSDRLLVKNLEIGLPNTSLTVGDLDLSLNSIDDAHAVVEGYLTPSDLRSVVPALEDFSTPWTVGIEAAIKRNTITVSDFRLAEADSGSALRVVGGIKNYQSKDSLDITVDGLNADLSSRLIAEALDLMPDLNDKTRHAAQAAGRIILNVEGFLSNVDSGEAKGGLITDIGSLDFNVVASGLRSAKPKLSLSAEAEDVDFGEFLSTDKIGKASFNVEADVAGLNRNADGHIEISSNYCDLLGNRLTDIEIVLNKEAQDFELKLDASSEDMLLSGAGGATLAGADSDMDMHMKITGFNPAVFKSKNMSSISEISGEMLIKGKGNTLDNLTGLIDIKNLGIKRRDGEMLNLSNLTATIEASGESNGDDEVMKRDVRIHSDWIDGQITGTILPASIGNDLKRMAGVVLPTLLSERKAIEEVYEWKNDFTFNFNIKGETAPYVFFDSPVHPLADIPINGYIQGPQGKANVSIHTPYLLQGKNKLIRDVRLSADLDALLGMAKMNTGLIFPAKKGDAEIAADIYAAQDKVNVNLGINPTIPSSVKGGVALTAAFSRVPDPFGPKGELAVDVEILPSAVSVNEMVWNMANGRIDYSGNRISVSNFLLSHENQYVKIDGVASDRASDQLRVRLNDIDLEYIFNILNINYVSFGGMATGEVVGSLLLTKTPVAKTEYLRVKGLSYNGAVLGDGDLASDYDASQQMVGIYAVIRDPLTRRRKVNVDGGIWVTRDSLSFGFDADRVNVGIMKPFVSAFCSDLYGEASGKCKLYGTFSDIDMIGDLKADTLSMKLDFTNTWYHACNDSVYLHRGVIDVPPLTLYDDEGHTAEFSGWLRHTYFHDPVFSFRLKDAKSLLCYDTNSQINPLWYGTIYGSGHAQINGQPGLIDIDMNMTTEEGSKFYYIISDAEDIAQYSFLTFTDRRKEQLKSAAVDTVPEYLKKFRKQAESMDGGSSNVVLSLKGTVTNDALVTLVMDPKAGDNITARGQGALQMDYNLASNDLRMIGTYVLDEGNYNFTLQDIIIKNFNIRKGSLIKFNGDPMNATLDIAATYRVNTNLTDLDESFSNDKELNRTNVPVDAVLLVDGPMTNPDITFDIELPSLTSDVERKVKSIVSTNDMMSRQIIYLLAMNRFYTPEYTNGQGSGAEWSSLASSTISSQLSNILSQMTDKLDVAPSFRSDKGDFTDMEFDLALSSRLLNNRLLINGNFGYRDKNTSNTQFIGDFDIEYLLSKNGNLRLKAYNHFNDQNYYLRSALTTQGVGVVFRKDFDRLLRRREADGKEESIDEKETLKDPIDSVSDKVPEEINDKIKNNK